MFYGKHDVADNHAIMYSLLGCCAASDINSCKWLTDELKRISYYTSDYWISSEKIELSNNFLKNFKALQQSCTGNLI